MSAADPLNPELLDPDNPEDLLKLTSQVKTLYDAFYPLFVEIVYMNGLW